MVIRVKDLVGDCNTNAQGEVLRTEILRVWSSPLPSISVDFSGIPAVTSSFVNSAFVDLLDDVTFVELKDRVKIRNVSKQVGEMILFRMRSKTNRDVVAA